MKRRWVVTIGRVMTAILTVVMIFGGLQFAPLRLNVPPASATQITINGDLFNTTGQYGPSPSVVWVSDTTGHAFYIDDTTDTPAYKKTTDSGASWGGEVELGTDQDWEDIAVWYDQWTPGDTTGTYIYMVAHETLGSSDDDVYFKRLDTASDTLSPTGTTWTEIANGTDDVTAATTGSPSIVKSTTGYLYVLYFIGGSSNQYYVYYATSTAGSSWTDSGFAATAGVDHGQLVPLASGNIMLIILDADANTLQSRVYTVSTTAWSNWTEISSANGFNQSTTYDVTWGAAVNKNIGDIYIVGNNAPGVGGA